MYLEHFGLTDPPFKITPDTSVFYEGARRGAILKTLVHVLLSDEGMVKISGEVGSGKTMLCRALIERLSQKAITIYISNPNLNHAELLFTIAQELNVEIPPDQQHEAVVRLQAKLLSLFTEGKKVILILDEAQAMATASLEEIRLLSNLESERHKLLQLAFFGQPELDQRLATHELRQLRERITHHFVLSPLTLEEIDDYLHKRLKQFGYTGEPLFSKKILKIIDRHTMGLLRRINILADKALLAAYAKNKKIVDRAALRVAIRDANFSDVLLEPPSATKILEGLRGWVLAVLFLLVLAGAAYQFKEQLSQYGQMAHDYYRTLTSQQARTATSVATVEPLEPPPLPTSINDRLAALPAEQELTVMVEQVSAEQTSQDSVPVTPTTNDLDAGPTNPSITSNDEAATLADTTETVALAAANPASEMTAGEQPEPMDEATIAASNAGALMSESNTEIRRQHPVIRPGMNLIDETQLMALYTTSEDWLMRVVNDHWVLQFMYTSDRFPKSIIKFINELSKELPTMQILAFNRKSENPKVSGRVSVFAFDFHTRADANVGLNALKKDIRDKYKPQLREIKLMLEE